MKANHKTSYASLDGVNTPVKIEPGQFISGRYSLHSEYYSRQKRSVRKFSPWTLWKKLKVLEGMQILSIKSCNKYSIITIINWGTYQNVVSEDEHQNEHQLSNSRATSEHQLSTSKELNNNDKKLIKNANTDSDPQKPESGSPLDERHIASKEEFQDFRKVVKVGEQKRILKEQATGIKTV
jgi:hypothetical protein